VESKQKSFASPGADFVASSAAVLATSGFDRGANTGGALVGRQSEQGKADEKSGRSCRGPFVSSLTLTLVLTTLWRYYSQCAHRS